MNFDITQYHKFTLTEINDMIPFERDIYVQMLEDKVKKEKQQQEL